MRRAREVGLSPRELAIVASACAGMPGGLDDDAVAPGRIERRTRRGERSDRRPPRAAAADRRARGRARRLPARPAARPADGAAPRQRPCGRRRGAGADARHADRASSRRRSGRPSSGRAIGRARKGARGQSARAGDELVAAQALARAFLPAKSLFEEVGEMVILTAPHAGRGGQAALPLRRGAGRPDPLRAQALLVADADLDLRPLPRRARPAGGGLPRLVGALDRLGGFFVVTAVRFIGPIVTAAVVAGVAGTAITADLGARKIREELDALQVLGVDPIKNLVVPRFIALVVITALLDVFAIVFGLTAGIVAVAPLPPAARWLLRDPVRQRADHRRLGLGARCARCSARSSPSSAATRG